MSAPRPDVSVIVPVHGDRGGLEKTLDHLAGQRTRLGVEVIVVDNGDNGDLSSIAADHPCTSVVAEPSPGSYRARNAGVRAARGDVLAFTDADCLPVPTWLDAGVAALDDAGPGVFVGGRIHVTTPPGRRASAAELWQVAYDLTQEDYVTARGWAATANVLVRRADLERVGPFAETESGGDREWGERATARGVRGVYSAAAQVDHPARPTLGALLAKLRRVTRGAVAREEADGIAVFPQGVLRAVSRPPVRSSWRRSAGICSSPLDRARFVATALYVHEYRTVYGWLLRRRASPATSSTNRQ